MGGGLNWLFVVVYSFWFGVLVLLGCLLGCDF